MRIASLSKATADANTECCESLSGRCKGKRDAYRQAVTPTAAFFVSGHDALFPGIFSIHALAGLRARVPITALRPLVRPKYRALFADL